VGNTKKGQVVKFNIVNLLKPDSLFNEGMKPVVFSGARSAEDGTTWHHAGYDISYFKNNILKEGGFTG